MARQTKVMKGLIIFIFAMFILFTALSGLMYLGGGNGGSDTQTGDNLTGAKAQTGITLSGTNLTGNNLTGKINTGN